MIDLAWLVQHPFTSLTRRDHDWVFVFDQDVRLVVCCLWRLLEQGTIRLTSQDDGQQFGLPAPLDMADEVTRRLGQSSITGVELREGLLDLDFQFSTGHVLQIIPDSSGYEAWNLSRGHKQYLAVGGGDLVVFGDKV
jgi:hypothetical protein